MGRNIAKAQDATTKHARRHPVVKRVRRPCLTASSRRAPSPGMLNDGVSPQPPEAMRNDTLSAQTSCQRCSTATAGDHPGQRRWVCVSKNRPRACLTPFRRRVHHRAGTRRPLAAFARQRLVLDDWRASSRAGGRARQCRVAKVQLWRCWMVESLEYIVRPLRVKMPSV